MITTSVERTTHPRARRISGYISALCREAPTGSAHQMKGRERRGHDANVRGPAGIIVELAEKLG
jgi:hypothetical protein